MADSYPGEEALDRTVLDGVNGNSAAKPEGICMTQAVGPLGQHRLVL
jgi:hypothetical protein